MDGISLDPLLFLFILSMYVYMYKYVFYIIFHIILYAFSHSFNSWSGDVLENLKC